MSISSAPCSIAVFASNAVTFESLAPKGKPTTVTIFTPEPSKFSLANFT